MALLTALCASLLLMASTAAFAGPLKVALDDRVDPVPIGEEMVYEIEVKVTGTETAPGVVATLELPPGTTFVSARRQPDFAPIDGQVSGDEVTFELGDLPPCDKKDLPACRDVWALVRIEPEVDPGTILQGSVTVTSTDPGTFPPDSHTTYTSAGSFAIRKGRVNFAAIEGRDRIQLEGDVGRTGWESPLVSPPPNLDISNGIRVRVGEVGETPVLDVTVPADAFKCNGLASVRCTLRDPREWRPLGLDRLTVLFRFDHLQRNNPNLLVRTHQLTLPSDYGPELEITIDADGETYTDTVLLEQKGNRLTYAKPQNKP
ncbi:MAG: hypothetical protein AB1689_05480 [Thermodesulfobacteriota bacterium]